MLLKLNVFLRRQSIYRSLEVPISKMFYLQILNIALFYSSILISFIISIWLLKRQLLLLLLLLLLLWLRLIWWVKLTRIKRIVIKVHRVVTIYSATVGRIVVCTRIHLKHLLRWMRILENNRIFLIRIFSSYSDFI